MYVIDQYGKNPIFQINSHIGFDEDSKGENDEIISGEGQGIDGKIFSREFFETDALKPDSITVYTNSMGGDVQQSLDMFTAIARAKSRTKGIIAGFAYSCSGWIPLACDIVEMTNNSRWMCHMPYDPTNPEQKSDFLDTVVDIIATTISDKSGRNGKPKKTKEQILDMMKKKTYLTSEQMYNEGLIDKMVTPSGKLIKQEPYVSAMYNSGNIDSKQIKTFYKINQVALNQFLNNKTSKKMSYPKIVNRLNAMKAVNFSLTEDSDESEIIAAIARVENKLNAVNIEKVELSEKLDAANSLTIDREKRLKEMESKAKDSETKAAEDKAAYDKMCMNLENMEADNKVMKEKIVNFEKDATTIDTANKKEKAKNLVAGYAIKFATENKEDREKVITMWEEKALNDFDGAKLLLDSIATRIKFPRPEDSNKSNNSSNEGKSAMQLLEEKRVASNKERRKLWHDPINN